MEKLISKSIYCDYNSTSPLSESVKSFLGAGDFLFANPSSVHQLGKKSKKVIREVSEYIMDLYSLNQREKSCIFHSGATEGLNSLILGLVYKHILEKGKSLSLFYSPLDHSCIVNLCPLLGKLGATSIELPILSTGEIDLAKAKKLISDNSADVKILNYTWVNNEIGLVQSLSHAKDLKDNTDCVVIVDAVQSPGKIEGWQKIEPSLDAYVFSAHKFGALKGVGFTLLNNGLEISPALNGGGQQNGLRSGTENIMGIQTIELAYRDLLEVTCQKDYYSSQKSFIKSIEEHIFSIIGNELMMVSKNLKNRNVNTISFVSPDVKANVIMMSMDLNGLEVSSGSACSSGASLPSRILTKLGFSNEQSHGGIRLSFSPSFSSQQAQEVKKRLTLSLGKYYHK